jgi:alkylation response protein AidB-like acyl-CoA dehydrogenase
MLLDVARDFCARRSPMAKVREVLESDSGYDAATWGEMVGLGWTGIALPESCGGSSMGIGSVVPVVESMGRAMLGTPLISSTLAAQLLLRASPGSASEPILGEIAAGAVATVALLESADWGDPHMASRLDGEGRLLGTKKFVTDASAADIFVVALDHGDGLALGVVRAGQLPDGAISPCRLIDLTKRAATVDFSGVQLDPSALITGPAVGAALRDHYLIGALLSAAEGVGSAAACLDTVVEYLKTRRQFGKLIGSYQALKHPAVDILSAVDSGRSFIYHAASLAVDESLGRDAEIACRMAKAQATETLTHAGDRAVQFHGGMGFTWECDAQLYIRRAQWTQQQFGDAQHHRKRLAALLLDA